MRRKRFTLVILYSVCGIAFISGCSKKEAQAPAPENTATPVPANSATPAPAREQAVPVVVPKSPTSATDLPDSVKATIAAAHSAIAAKDYQKATALMSDLVAYAKQPLPQQQMSALWSQSEELKQEFMAAASADPTAAAALDKLRRTSHH